MKFKRQSPYGALSLALREERVDIQADSDLAAFWGQGFATAHLRLWQLDLSRRIAKGQLCEILGAGARKTDVFQRRLNLTELAEREVARCQTQAQAGVIELQRLQIQAYVEGLNTALHEGVKQPIECRLLGYMPEPFTELDVYVLAQLKYFINSAWQYEIFHTHMLKRLTATQARQLFATFSFEGENLPPLQYPEYHQRSEEAEQALKDALKGLTLLGLSSPDTGSNVFAVSSAHTEDGKPLLASDPHMGQVNPNFSLLFNIQSKEGLSVFGANFVGIPGIVVGRNKEAAWGMVGLMADNQDLAYAEVDWNAMTLKAYGESFPLEAHKQYIQIKNKPSAELITYSFKYGRVLSVNENYVMFLRWPALDNSMGDITLYDLAKCHDWTSFKAGLSRIYNAPMMAGYADIHGDIGLHAVGLLPRRTASQASQHLGALLQNAQQPASAWQGYLSFDELPQEHNPACGYVLYANQYSSALLANKHPISNRWHPPTRAQRIQQLLAASKVSAQQCMQIQDDKIDGFAQQHLAFLLAQLATNCELTQWSGDTRQIAQAQLFERWIYQLAVFIFVPVIGKKRLALYCDFWPSFRWCVIDVLQHHLQDWVDTVEQTKLQENYAQVVTQLVRTAFSNAQQAPNLKATMAFAHTLKKPKILAWLFTLQAPFTGGNRETIHATRQNTDFLTSSQSANQGQHKPFSFGPAFKFVSQLDQHASVHYMINTPANGSPWFWTLKTNLKRWQKGERYQLSMNN